MTRARLFMTVCEAEEACLRLLMERRTRGRMLLFIAVGDLLDEVR